MSANSTTDAGGVTCPDCNGTGYVGDNGPGQRGNREWEPCHCRKAAGPQVTSTQPANGWRDIASAPKDGTHVKVLYPHRAKGVEAWYDKRLSGWFAVKGFALQVERISPTHWQPLTSADLTPAAEPNAGQGPQVTEADHNLVHSLEWQHKYGNREAAFKEAAASRHAAVSAATKELREALEGIIRVADRNTDEFNRARAALQSKEGHS